MKKNKWHFFQDNRKSITMVSIANFFTNILPGVFNLILYQIVINLTVPVLSGQAIDYNILKQFCWWYVGIFVLYIALSMWSQTLNYIKAYTMSSDLRLKLGDKLRRFSLSFFKQHDPGDVASRLLSDVQQAETIIARLLPDMAAAVIAPIILLVFLALTNGKLSGIILASAVFAGIFLFIARKIIANLGRKHVKTIVDTSSRIREYFTTIKLLKSYNLIGKRFERMDEVMLQLKKVSFQTEVWTAIPIQIFLFCLDAGYLLMLFLAVKMSAAGDMPIKDVFTFAVMGYFFFEVVKSLGPVLVELRYISISTKRIGEILETEEPDYDVYRHLPNDNHITFDNVSFGYGKNDVLNQVSCHIPEQSMTALVGKSGSGKTTITSLIARFWDVESGQIRIGDIPITELEPDKLLSKLSMVFQDVYLFNDTIANNIRVGKQDATMEEIKHAAKLASCDQFIRKLPEGYDTLVSEGGNSLSGGEKQRISIARAILKDAPIVMLDEATASLDPENEADIQSAMEHLVREKTIIVIAHQFKSIAYADQIIVLDNGKIIEQGVHQGLIASHGLYSRLWQEQQKAKGWKMRAAVKGVRS
ncbi:ABC transporter ATP-binding protein [Vallitalea pronyensis]|uniref:ABC transporter ATP-binding protein n=1 Tax=Vallitalea pronyensis TaxID=1348613 RepID=A0A8J8SHY9_9FIRM|nr:ABC transporter ATP-binding protein [Vallitalea pronyensis]QUI23907.1 ABC transporter ATP-binding protein [Vallitalea pronyensis]